MTYSLFLGRDIDPPETGENWVICRYWSDAIEMVRSCAPDRMLFEDSGISRVFAQECVAYDLFDRAVPFGFVRRDFEDRTTDDNRIDAMTDAEQLLAGYMMQKLQGRT
jgi:hypothetical protein